MPDLQWIEVLQSTGMTAQEIADQLGYPLDVVEDALKLIAES